MDLNGKLVLPRLHVKDTILETHESQQRVVETAGAVNKRTKIIASLSSEKTAIMLDIERRKRSRTRGKDTGSRPRPNNFMDYSNEPSTT